jgi:AcrR family transcriptional regulator
MRSRRDERKTRTRAGVLASARECFSREGPAATSTQRVSSAAGVSHGTLFLHFPRREELIDAVVTEFAADLRARLEPPAASLAEELDAQLRLLAVDEQLYSRLLSEEFALPEAARGELRSLEGLLTGRVAAAYGADRDRGELRALPPRLLAATWLSLIQTLLRKGEHLPVLLLKGPEIRQYCLELVRP